MNDKSDEEMVQIARRLKDSLHGDPNVYTIGIANQDLVIYTIKKSRVVYPEIFEGHRVSVHKFGKIAPLGPVK